MRHTIIGLLTAVCCHWFSVASAQNVTFDIRDFQIVGNHLLTTQMLNDQVKPFTGKQKVYGDIQKALEAIEQAYQAAGYSAITVYVPEQDISAGSVTIQVTEALLAKVSVEGAEHHNSENVLAAFPSLRTGQTPRLVEIANNTQLANENGSKKNSVVLASGSQDATIDATVKVEDQSPDQWMVTADNSGTPSTGVHRLGMLFQHHNLFNQDRTLTLGYTTSPEKKEDVKIFTAGYRVPLYQLGDSIDLVCGYSDVSGVQNMGSLGSASFVGKGKLCSARYNWLMPRSGEVTSRFVLGLDYKDFDRVDVNQINSSGNVSLTQVPSYTLKPVSITYMRQLQQPGLMVDLSLSVSQNFAESTAGGDERINTVMSSSGYRVGNADFRVYRATLSALTLVNEAAWQWRNSISIQKADDALISGEQLGVGGASSVRGLPERAFSVDEGMFVSSELTLSELKPVFNLEGSLKPAIFVDHARGENGGYNRTDDNADTVDALFKSISATSAGIGLRYNLNNQYVIKLDVARLLEVNSRTYDHSPSSDLLNQKMQATQAFYEDEDNAWRLHASLMIKF